MLLELIAALSAGFALFGVTMLVNTVTGRRMARWAYPVAFGLGMIAYTIWSEYTWADRSTAQGSPYVVVERTEGRVWYRPWTFVVPQTSRLIVLDRRFSAIHPDQPDYIQTRVVRLARWVPDSGFLAVFDCATRGMAPMIEGVEMLPDGTLEGASWTVLPEGDPVLTGACALREEIANARGDADPGPGRQAHPGGRR
jgi:hypothetical protein